MEMIINKDEYLSKMDELQALRTWKEKARPFLVDTLNFYDRAEVMFAEEYAESIIKTLTELLED